MSFFIFINSIICLKTKKFFFKLTFSPSLNYFAFYYHSKAEIDSTDGRAYKIWLIDHKIIDKKKNLNCIGMNYEEASISSP